MAKIIGDLDDYVPWSGAVSTWERIVDENKVEDFDFLSVGQYVSGWVEDG